MEQCPRKMREVSLNPEGCCIGTEKKDTLGNDSEMEQQE